MDAIAQMTILLGVMCYLILGLSENPCNFIINVVTLIVKMAMATEIPQDADQYNDNQNVILEELPTSLYAALNKFNVDGKTTAYTICPLCNYTHKPHYDQIASMPNILPIVSTELSEPKH